MNVRNRRAATCAVHAGTRRIEHALVPPVFQTATYTFGDSAAVRRFQAARRKNRSEYTRYGSPTQETLEAKIAGMLNAPAALVTASGMSAIFITLLTLLKPGDRLVAGADCYGGTRVLLETLLARFGVKTEFVAPETDALVRAVRPGTAAVLVEFPTNPHLRVVDLPVLAAACRRRRALLLVDPTLAGAFACDPLKLGADLLLVSLTKYIGGHHDVIAGAVAGRRALVDRVRETHGMAGTLLAPDAAQLVLRGSRTLALRMRQHHENGRRIAAYLAAHPRVREVWYPELPQHPDHAVARRLLRGCGGVVSFRLGGSLRSAEAFLDRLRLFTIAPSLGGAESLAESVPTMAFWKRGRAGRKKLGIPEDLIRLAAGLEDPDDLLADLEQALRRSGR